MIALRRRGLCAGRQTLLEGDGDLAAELGKSLERSLSCLPLRNMMFLN